MTGKPTANEITDSILLASTKRGARLFRQNTGMGWVGKILGKTKTAITLGNPRPLHAGLCKGSSDIIGITPIVVTQEMVGKTVGLFTAREVKAGNDQLTTEQRKFLEMVNKLGGIGMVDRSLDA
ncbi:VRR-NUC domain-containing protein [uncultured Paraglaciecola sp.]|uniref:VRR-NUC domain-containing protein n=1 Tax=uncultured Paraglaciecola sp. TaxID=1765024 RepID=UPI00262DE224|nr:VRR-NUC domain-containing protein [uncultured Paraglaciecola sp.]